MAKSHQGFVQFNRNIPTGALMPRYRRKRAPATAETKERIRAALVAHYAAPEARAEAVKRMARLETRQKISERVSAALADPAVKARHRAGLARAWDDPAKRERQAALTRERMAKWRAERLEAAAMVLQQMPKAERDAALAGLASAARGGAR